MHPPNSRPEAVVMDEPDDDLPEDQGDRVPDWAIPDGAVKAAIVGLAVAVYQARQHVRRLQDLAGDGDVNGSIQWDELAPDLAGWSWALDLVRATVDSHFWGEVYPALLSAGLVASKSQMLADALADGDVDEDVLAEALARRRRA